MTTALLILALVLAALVAVAFALRIAVLSRRRKSSGEHFRLVGRTASVTRTLAPEGAVLVEGELWRARLCDEGRVARDGARVRVVGARGHLLLVEPLP